MAIIVCQGCGAPYDTTNDVKMEAFKPLPVGTTITSPKGISDAGLTMLKCPKDRSTPGSGPDEGEVDEQRIIPSEDEVPADLPPGQHVFPEDTPL